MVTKLEVFLLTQDHQYKDKLTRDCISQHFNNIVNRNKTFTIRQVVSELILDVGMTMHNCDIRSLINSAIVGKIRTALRLKIIKKYNKYTYIKNDV